MHIKIFYFTRCTSSADLLIIELGGRKKIDFLAVQEAFVVQILCVSTLRGNYYGHDVFGNFIENDGRARKKPQSREKSLFLE